MKTFNTALLALLAVAALMGCGRESDPARPAAPIVFGTPAPADQPKPSIEYCDSIGKRYTCRGFTCFCGEVL